MYQEYMDVAEFFVVYISEAHAVDDKYPVSYAKKLGIKEHTSFSERCTVAGSLKKDKKLTIPFLIDGMDGAVEKHYKGWPTRVYLIRSDGRLGVAGKRGPWGLKPALKAVNKWLAEYKRTGQEPAPIVAKKGSTYGKLQAKFQEAYERSDYREALTIAQRLYELLPDALDTLYNIACLHCLLGHEEEAYTWLEKAIDAGYDDADHLLKDDDFKAIREQDRFRRLVERVREISADDEEPAVDEGLVASILGEWEMKTRLEEHSIEATMSLSIQDGRLAGVWLSQGREMALKELRFYGSKLGFKRSIGPGQELQFHGTVDGDRISGTYTGVFGELECTGKRKSTQQRHLDHGDG